jgi:hypothetical protein
MPLCVARTLSLLDADTSRDSPQLAPLTAESLAALARLRAHVPVPEPCPGAVPAYRRAAVLLGLFGGRRG